MRVTEERNQRKVCQGCVVLDKMDKIVTVVAETRRSHPIYSKRMKHSKKYKAHDEDNAAKVRDIAKTMETRLLSATKRFRLLEVIEETVIT